MTPRDQARWIQKHMDPTHPVPAKPRKRRNGESLSQRAVVKWWHHACASFGVPEQMLFKITNEGWRSHAASNVMRLEGMRTGAPDLMLACVRGKQAGLFVEMKAEYGVVSDAQKEFLRLLHAQNYAVTVAYSTQHAIKAIEDYLKT